MKEMLSRLAFTPPVVWLCTALFKYTIDYGVGINIFHHKNQATTIGYRYQHLSNANISYHNQGTDADTFYSRFKTTGDQRTERELR